MPRKTYVSADELLLDSFRLARLVLDSGWRPDVLLALWRGGTPVGAAVHEFLAHHGIDARHMAVTCRSYSGVGQAEAVRIAHAGPAFRAIRPGERVLVVDDIFDTGRTAAAVLRRLASRHAETRLATVFWKPVAGTAARKPDYHVRVTRNWVVFPHELQGLTPAELRRKPAALTDLLANARPWRGASAAARLLACLALGWSLAARGAPPGAQPPRDTPRPPRIVASFYPMYVVARNVAGGIPGVEIGNLAPVQTGCLHDYQMTSADRVRLDAADILVVNGAGMEPFLDRIAKLHPALRVIDASAGLLPGIPPGGAPPDPHLWLGVTLHIGQVSNVAARLAQADPPRAARYLANGAAYAARLDRLRTEMRAGVRGAASRSIVTFHSAFTHLAAELDLRVVDVIAHDPESAPGARDLARMVETIRRDRPAAIFAESHYPASAAAAVARETGLRLFTLDTLVSGPDRPDAYLEGMRRNLAELQRALGTAGGAAR
jgi:zinc transport system substrate-binding protein